MQFKTLVNLLFVIILTFNSVWVFGQQESMFSQFAMGYRYTLQKNTALTEAVRKRFENMPDFSANSGEQMLSIGAYNPRMSAYAWFAFSRQSKTVQNVYSRLSTNSFGFNYCKNITNNKHNKVTTTFNIGIEVPTFSFVYGEINDYTTYWEEDLFWPTQLNDKINYQQVKLTPGLGIFKGEKFVLGFEAYYALNLLTINGNKNYKYNPPIGNFIFQLTGIYRPDY
jgi:hypothetical protein